MTRSADRVGPLWVLALTLGVVSVFASWFGPLQILLPVQADRIGGPGGREALLGLVVGVGAAVALVANPVWGLLSDRCRAGLGTRMPVVYVGTAIGVAGQVVLLTADSGPATVTGWVLVQLGFNGPFAVLAALMADRVPEEQRGVVGSLFGVGQIVGVISGVVVAESVGGGATGYLVLAVLTPALLSAIVVAGRAPVASPAHATAGGDGGAGPGIDGRIGGAGPGIGAGVGSLPRVVLADFRPTRQYAWAWLLRFLMNLTNAILLVYLFFFLDSVVGAPDPGNSVLMVTVITLVLSAVCAAMAGSFSDRLHRRREFAAAGALITAGGLLGLASSTTMPAVLAAAAVLGVGWGLFIAVDMAIITGSLATSGTAGTLLGVANIATSLPQVVAPAIAVPLVTSAAGYPALYWAGAGIAVAAALCTLPLRGVR
ncbi:MFS transporter [Dietzia cercidiphylli]|uniref:MFS transporter n=1 Tax=Dietzia cercidiphylli TaxID=498199 RepID=UPI00223B7E43|nr:MFS transporter [Dietzia cercidiphylli]MCT1516538.1 MFS transporter [Dietzia cercidiphylli]